jgi:hypothetical protein
MGISKHPSIVTMPKAEMPYPSILNFPEQKIPRYFPKTWENGFLKERSLTKMQRSNAE